MKTAEFWHVGEDATVCCDLCPQACRIKEGGEGRCRVRGVRGGGLVALDYGRVSSAQYDPIEKKPLYHVYPGRDIFSIGGWGCNFRCRFCQNWSISQRAAHHGPTLSPRDIVRAATEGAGGAAPVGVAYTYNEPLIGFEFVRDCAAAVREQGLINVLVTNGFINPGPAEQLLPWIDALNIDIKSMDDAFYRAQCGGRLAPVLAFAEQAMRQGCHVEITNLVIPGLNDSDASFHELAEWIAETLGALTPLHVSAYRPEYEMDRPRTPVAVVERAGAICHEHLEYVYVGNVVSDTGQHTRCPQCGAVLVERAGYSTRLTGIDGGACAQCLRPVDILLQGAATARRRAVPGGSP